MRYKRLEKFKRERRRKLRKYLLFAVVMPVALVFIGYLVAALIILPSMPG